MFACRVSNRQPQKNYKGYTAKYLQEQFRTLTDPLRIKRKFVNDNKVVFSIYSEMKDQQSDQCGYSGLGTDSEALTPILPLKYHDN